MATDGGRRDVGGSDNNDDMAGKEVSEECR